MKKRMPEQSVDTAQNHFREVVWLGQVENRSTNVLHIFFDTPRDAVVPLVVGKRRNTGCETSAR